MKKQAVVVFAVILTCLFSTQGAFPWGSLTHAYITKSLVTEGGAILDSAIYGSTAPDFPSFMFGSPYKVYLEDRTHSDFLRVWKMARGGPAFRAERAAAYGFVAHNEEDYTAHSMSLVLDHGEGYVVQKAAVLNASLSVVWQLLELDGPQYADLRAQLSHQIIEFAGDLMIAMMDPASGQILSNAAFGRYGEFPDLFAKAYAGNLVAYSNRMGIRLNQPAAFDILAENEYMFRAGMMQYGVLFTNGNYSQILHNVAFYLQQMAALQGIQIADTVLVEQVLEAALFLIQADFPYEIGATIPFVAGKLALQRVAY